MEIKEKLVKLFNELGIELKDVVDFEITPLTWKEYEFSYDIKKSLLTRGQSVKLLDKSIVPTPPKSFEW